MKATYLGKVQETPTDWSFRFSKPEEFQYSAGQYSVIRFPLQFEDHRGNARTCSLSSSPTEEYLQFTFTLRDTGYKKTLMLMDPGTEVELFPPKGKMIIENSHSPRCVMIAGGIGVSPYRGIIKYVYDKQITDKHITLLYSDKTISEIAYKQEFDEIVSRSFNIDIIYTLTRHSAEHGAWEGELGRLNRELIQRNMGDVSLTDFMVCGPVEMVQTVMGYLSELNIPRERIMAELFTGY